MSYEKDYEPLFYRADDVKKTNSLNYWCGVVVGLLCGVALAVLLLATFGIYLGY